MYRRWNNVMTMWELNMVHVYRQNYNLMLLAVTLLTHHLFLG